MEHAGSDERAGDRALIADLVAAIGRDRVRAEPLELSLYARDAGIGRGKAAAVCFPARAGDAGGAYSVSEPALSSAIRDRKVEQTRAVTGDERVTVVSANPGCSMHLAAAGVDVRHPAELLAQALEPGTGGERP